MIAPSAACPTGRPYRTTERGIGILGGVVSVADQPRGGRSSDRSGKWAFRAPRATVAYADERYVRVDAMTDEFSISLRFVALRTADLDRSREFYENLLGLNVCGEKPGEFLQFAVGDAALCFDLFDGEEPPAAIFAVRGLEPLC